MRAHGHRYFIRTYNEDLVYSAPHLLYRTFFYTVLLYQKYIHLLIFGWFYSICVIKRGTKFTLLYYRKVLRKIVWEFRNIRNIIQLQSKTLIRYLYAKELLISFSKKNKKYYDYEGPYTSNNVIYRLLSS